MGRRALLLLALPVLLLILCLRTSPFAHTLVQEQFSTRTLSAAQRTNLRLAAQRLDGAILQPGDRFSFNRVIGPRTTGRGYLAAPSYLGGDSPDTVGGGICLLSSALYRLSLESGLTVLNRTPHLRTIHSVPPGLDATVWYGGADLQFSNSLPFPIRLRASLNSGALSLALEGARPVKPMALTRLISQSRDGRVQVTVLRDRRPVSHDLYRLSP